MEEKKEKRLTIVRYTPVPSMDPQRIGEPDVVLQVMLEDGTTHVIQLPKKALTEEAIAEAIREQVAERDRWQGKSLRY